MIRKSRLVLLVVAASLPMLGACADAPTSPLEFEAKKELTRDSLVAMGCGDWIPWGKAPCVDNL